MLQLDLQQILSQAFSFLILVWVLKRFAWRPLLSVLDQRRVRVEEEFARIEQSKTELVKLQQDYQQRIAKIEEEARAKIQHAIIDGKRIATEIQEQAREQGHVLLAKAKDTIELELDKARVTMRDQLAAMTTDAVERVLRQKLDAQRDQQLINSVLDELERKGTSA